MPCHSKLMDDMSTCLLVASRKLLFWVLINLLAFKIMFLFPCLSHGLFPCHSEVMDGFIRAAEYMEMPFRRSDYEPLQKLFVAVRSTLRQLSKKKEKNIKTEQAKFSRMWKKCPSLVKVGLC